MPKIPSTTQITEFKLRKALSAVLRKLGVLKTDEVADEETLIALSKLYVERKSTLNGVRVGKSKPTITTPRKAKEADFDLKAWQGTLTIPEGYSEEDIPY